MPNQEKKNSLLSPVGKADPMPGTNGAFTMAVFEASQVPVGVELYLQPKDSRLRLEVEVANDNASHWHGHLVASHAKSKKLRQMLRKLQLPESGLAPDLVAEIGRLLEVE